MTACLVLAVALFGAQGSASAARAPASTGTEAVRVVLTRRNDIDNRTEQDLVQDLFHQGPELVPTLFELVTGDGLEAFYGSGDAPEPALLCSPDRIGELALGALALHPPGAVVAHLKQREAAQPTREARLAAARVLGALRSATGLELLLSISGALESELDYSSVRSALQQALAAILVGDSHAFPALEDAVPKLSRPVLLLVAGALEETGRPEGASLLGSLLGKDTQLDLAVLGSLAELERRFPWRIHIDVRPQIRSRLANPDPELRRAAATALGKMRDTDSFPNLIARLDDKHAGVARAALWSVRELSGTELPRTSREWSDWLERELAWWNDAGERLRQDLVPDDPARFVAALRELTPRRFGRDDLALELGEKLPALPPDLQVLTCNALGRMGSMHCVPALVDLLFNSERPARLAAWEALQALTEERFPPEPRLWEAYAFD